MAISVQLAAWSVYFGLVISWMHKQPVRHPCWRELFVWECARNAIHDSKETEGGSHSGRLDVRAYGNRLHDP